MNEIYNLVAKRTVEKSETYLKTDKKTNEKVEATRKRKVIEPTNLVFVKPTPLQLEEAEFFYGQSFNKLIQAGFLTRAMLQKRFSEVGGIGDGDEGIKHSLANYMESMRVIEFYEGEKDLSSEKSDLLRKAKEDFALAQQHLVDFQESLSAQFGQTADVKAEHKLMEWLMVHFLYIKEKKGEDVEYFPFFDGVNYDEKRAFYLTLQEDVLANTDVNIVKKKQLLEDCFDELVRAITVWHSGGGKTEQEIRDKIKELFDDEKG